MSKFKYGYFYGKEFKIPSEAVSDCTQRGANDEAVAYWQPKIAMNDWTRGEKILGLKECGGWTKEELDAMSDNDLEEKILWITCHDIKGEEDQNDLT